MSDVQQLVIVGGGIIGTMHAVEGVRLGFNVTQIERDLAPESASVRNFGLIWVSGRAPGAELELALEARERWEKIAADAPGTGFRPNGSLTLARTKEELAALEAVASGPDAAQRGVVVLDPNEVRRKNPALCGEILGGLFCERDAAVEPRFALSALRASLEKSGSYRFIPGTDIRSISGRMLIDGFGQRHVGDLVVCCPGAATSGLFGELLHDAPLRNVRLQMLETEPYEGEMPTSVADGDSLRYYPAFAPYRDALAPQDPLAAEWRSQLLMVRRLAGHLTIGDTHAYDEPFSFDITDAPSRHLLGVAEALVGQPLPPVERRWAGVYCETTEPGLLYYRKEIEPGVFIVTGPGGRGMTMSPAISAATFQ